MLAITVILSIIATVVVWQSMDRATKSSKNDGALTALYQALAGITVLIFIPFEELRVATDWKIWALFATACIFYAINDRIMTTLYKHLPTSQISVIKQLSSVFVIIIGLVIFGEPFSFRNIIAAVIIITGNVLILYQKQTDKGARKKKFFYIILGVIANVSMSIALSLDIDISSHYNLAIYAALSLIMPSIIICIGDKNVNLGALKGEIVNGNKKAIIIAAIAQGIQIFTMLKAYQLGSIIVVAPLLALSVLINALYELIFLKEKDRWMTKILVSVMIFVAVIMISM